MYTYLRDKCISKGSFGMETEYTCTFEYIQICYVKIYISL